MCSSLRWEVLGLGQTIIGRNFFHENPILVPHKSQGSGRGDESEQQVTSIREARMVL